MLRSRTSGLRSWNSLLYGNCSYLCPFFNSHSGGWSPYWVHSARRPLLAYCTCPGWLWEWRTWWNKDCHGKPKYPETTCPRVTLPTTNPTWQNPGANPGRRGGNPATNRMKYGTAPGSALCVLLLFVEGSVCPGLVVLFFYIFFTLNDLYCKVILHNLPFLNIFIISHY
jgi:hypothetical protein